MDGISFIGWRRDLDYRAEAYALSMRPEPREDPLRRFGLVYDDQAFLAAIDRAFRD